MKLPTFNPARSSLREGELNVIGTNHPQDRAFTMKIRPIGKVLSCPQIDSYGNRHYGMAQVLFFNIPISETIGLWLLGYQAVRVCCRRDFGRLAGGAEAVEFEFVGLNGKAVFSGHGFLQVFNLAVVKFHNLPAFRTN